ncbi:MAG: restriction endonuclease subunit S [Chromatiaceae bacterium]|nr:restriction endonuclease subunit S [Chromatiaceae bacterium]
MSELPPNWTRAPLQILGHWGSGGTPKRTNPAYFAGGTIPWLVIGDLNGGVVTHASANITEAGLANSSAKLLPIDTLLIAMYGSIGKLGITGVECATNQAIASCAPDADVASLRYLFYALMSEQKALIAQGQGGAQQNISQGILKTHEIPLAPINEQQRITDKLEAVLARVDACRERLDRVPAILKRFRQTVLAAATSGKLTEGWRGSERDTPWMERLLVDLCDEGRLITYGVIKLGSDVLEGVPCLRTSNVRWLRIDTDGIKRIAPVLSSNYSRTILNGGEVLVNVRGTLGGVAVAQPEMAGWNVSREVAVVPIDTKRVNSFFLAYWIGSEESQRWLGGVKKGVAYVGINIEDLRNLPIGVPSMEEQQEIVRRVESLFAYADGLEARYQAARAQVERLTPALLAKAFRGELVPQDPDDEPASVLLERIRAARAAVPAKPKRGRGAALRESSEDKVAPVVAGHRS